MIKLDAGLYVAWGDIEDLAVPTDKTAESYS